MADPCRDHDRPPLHSPRLYGDIEKIAYARKVKREGCHMSAAEKRRLSLMWVITACREADPAVPYSTLVALLGISERHARRLCKLGWKRKLHNAKR